MSGHMYRVTCTMFATRLTQPGRGSQRRPLQTAQQRQLAVGGAAAAAATGLTGSGSAIQGRGFNALTVDYVAETTTPIVCELDDDAKRRESVKRVRLASSTTVQAVTRNTRGELSFV
jgi:hypothetical protein